MFQSFKRSKYFQSGALVIQLSAVAANAIVPAQTVTLAPLNVNLSPVTANATVPAQTVSIAPLTIALSPVVANAVVPAQTVSLTPLNIGLSPATANATVPSHTVTLAPLSIALNPVVANAIVPVQTVSLGLPSTFMEWAADDNGYSYAENDNFTAWEAKGTASGTHRMSSDSTNPKYRASFANGLPAGELFGSEYWTDAVDGTTGFGFLHGANHAIAVMFYAKASTGSNQEILANNNESNAAPGFTLKIRNSDSQLVHFVSNGSATAQVFAIGAVNYGEWNTIILAYDGTNWRYKLNDGAIVTDAPDATLASSGTAHQTNLNIGRRTSTPTLNLNGYVTEVKLWDVNLTDAQIDTVRSDFVSKYSLGQKIISLSPVVANAVVPNQTVSLPSVTINLSPVIANAVVPSVTVTGGGGVISLTPVIANAVVPTHTVSFTALSIALTPVIANAIVPTHSVSLVIPQLTRYIVPSGATGAWASHVGEIAEWNGSSWVYHQPDEGMEVFVEDETAFYTYLSGSWVRGLSMDSAGNVGLGALNPTDPLTLTGNNDGGQADELALVNSGSSNNTGVGLRFVTGAASGGSIAKVVGRLTDATNVNGALVLQARLYNLIWDVGYLGQNQNTAITGRSPAMAIGHTAPTEILHVKAVQPTTTTDGYLFLEATNNAGLRLLADTDVTGPEWDLQVVASSGNLRILPGLTSTPLLELANTPGIGFFNTTPAAQQTVTGSRGGNAALDSLLTALANYGIIINNTTS